MECYLLWFCFFFAFVVLASKNCAKIIYVLIHLQRCTKVRSGLRVLESSKSLVQICYADQNNWFRLRKLNIKTIQCANAWLDINKCCGEAKYLALWHLFKILMHW